MAGFGFLHLYVGQEAVAAGAMSNLRDDDQISSTHRGHGHAVAKGAQFRQMFAELFGRVDGYCKGRGGSMHINDLSIGMLGANGIVGGGIQILIEIYTFAAKYRGEDSVAIPFFGDGASNIGAFHEAANMAGILELPVVFVCENNGYAEFTALRDHMKLENVADRAAAYGMPSEICATVWTPSRCAPRSGGPSNAPAPAGDPPGRGKDLPLLRPPGRQGSP